MGFLTDVEIAALNPSELLPHATPIPTQIVSSDEYTPAPQREKTARGVFGGTNAKLYDFDISKRGDLGPDRDRFAVMREQYDKAGPARNNLRYGYVTGPVDWSALG